MKKDNIIIGIFLVIIGTVIFGNQNNIWDIDLFFKGWWTLFIIVPSIIAIFQKEYITGSIGLTIGSLMFLSANDIIEFVSIWPIFIILIGLVLIFKSGNIKETIAKSSYIAIFSGNDSKVSGEFNGTSITAIFGGVELNLKNSEIKNDVTINALCLFGGIDLIVPDNVIVKVKGFPIFGAIENKVNQNEGNIVYINANCIFGGITIK